MPAPDRTPAWCNFIAAYGTGNNCGFLSASSGSFDMQSSANTFTTDGGFKLTEVRPVSTGWAMDLNAPDLARPSAYDAIAEIESALGT